MKLVDERADVDGYASNGIPPLYQHGHVNFQFSYEKRLSPNDITSGFFVFFFLNRCINENYTYGPISLNFTKIFLIMTLNKQATSLVMVFDCGNK